MRAANFMQETAIFNIIFHKKLNGHNIEKFMSMLGRLGISQTSPSLRRGSTVDSKSLKSVKWKIRPVCAAHVKQKVIFKMSDSRRAHGKDSKRNRNQLS